MGRFNKTIDGVFVDIVGTNDQISSMDKFINYGNDIKKPSKELTKYSKQYQQITKKFGPEIQKMAKLEEIIMQLRSKDNIQDIKLSIVREYLYARCPFYRMGKTAKDIRVIVDKSEFWEGQTPEDLINNTEFMMKAVTKLTKAMEQEIESNIKEYSKMEGNL